MSDFKLTGKIKVINETQVISEKFSKREFVVTDTDAMYPQDIMFQIVQDKCSILDAYKVGEDIEVSFNLRGREWISPTKEVKYFNTLDAWRVEKAGAISEQYTEAKVTPTEAVEDDSLPF